MSRLLKQIVARVLLIGVLFLWGCMFSTPIDISGLWTGTMTWTSGPMTGLNQPISFNLTLVDRNVTGTVTLVSHGMSTFDLPITYGRARSVNLNLEAAGQNTMVPSNPEIFFVLEATYTTNSMSGTGSQSIDGTTYDFELEATLTAPATPES